MCLKKTHGPIADNKTVINPENARSTVDDDVISNSYRVNTHTVRKLFARRTIRKTELAFCSLRAQTRVHAARSSDYDYYYDNGIISPCVRVYTHTDCFENAPRRVY